MTPQADEPSNTLANGGDQQLLRLPIWLTEETNVILDLEATYEDTCRVLHIP